MYVPVAASYARRESERLAQSARPEAPVRPVPARRGPVEVGRVRRGAAAALRRSAEHLAPTR
jgi:hypothetical protein